MKINGVVPSKVINLYSVNKKETLTEIKKTSSDVIQISSVGKSLSQLSLDNNFQCSDKKIEELRNNISQGTYKPDSRLVAQKMMDIVKGREV